MTTRFRLLATALAAAGFVAAANAQTVTQYRFDIRSQDLRYALRAATREAGYQLFATADDLRGRQSPDLHANATIAAALEQLLAGTGLHAEISGKTIFIRGRSAPPRDDAADTAVATSEIVVTGSRIRGVQPTSEVIVATRATIERSGQTDIGGYVRTIPQNFGGGQAPGIVNVQGSSQNTSGGSNLNLRGLGPDATLTLLDGHRVAYDAAFQGVDISAIPLAALDRIEIVPDGASALYGSDAVGGVANVILRRDFDGLATTARYGAATDGGDRQQQYSAVLGKRWASGGLMAIVDYSRSTEIAARDRSYTRALNGSETLLPAARQLAAVITGHQKIGDHVEFDIDAQYSDRHSTVQMPFTATGDYFAQGSLTRPAARSYSVTPSLRIDLPSRWQLTVSGTYADSRTAVPSVQYANRVQILSIAGSYKDWTNNIEATAEGPLVTLPGGDVRLAAGGGYRTTGLDTLAKVTIGGQSSTLINFSGSRHIAYGYGELSVPVIGASDPMPFAEQLLLTGALRYENYQGVAEVASPKFGLVYKPVHDVTIRASWGKSFKAPTLYQENQLFEATLQRASSFGYPGALPSQTGLELVGGNPNLKPEKATTWTTTVGYEPGFARGLKLEASYFHIDYRDRVISPLTSIAGAYSNPAYQTLITRNPTAAQIAAIVARAPLGLENFSGQTYNPANVVLILDNALQNTAGQRISGVDVNASYGLDPTPGDHVELTGSATYLRSKETLTPDAAPFALAGTIFNPPHWRARAGASWDHRNFGLGSFVNYTGGTLDARFAPFTGVRSFTTLDTVVHFTTPGTSGPLQNISVLLSIMNILNQKPGLIRTTAPNAAPYDATNYAATGRLVSLTVTKKW